MNGFFRFPHTPHLAWLGSGQPRGDKVLTQSQQTEFLSHPLIVEEKVDGANLGFSVGENGNLRIQNRGSWLSRDVTSPQFKSLFRWVDSRSDTLITHLQHEFILFGEWCYAVHSIRYAQLPDWFLAFDLYNRTKGLFVAADERDDFVRTLNLEIVPCLGKGLYTLELLKSILGASALGTSRAEGLYLRTFSRFGPPARAKLVTPEFTQTIGPHWSKRSLQINALASGRSHLS